MFKFSSPWHITPNIPIHRISGKLRLPTSGDFQRYVSLNV